MVAAVGLLLVGAVVLYAGAEAAVRGASGYARAAGVPAFLIGALLFGIDFEGLGAALVAAGRGQTALAAGEVFGTILFLYSAAFGAALVVARRPLRAPSHLMVVAPAMPLATAALAISDRFVSRTEGVLLIVLYVAYVVVVLREGSLAEERAEEWERAPRGRATPALVAAVGLVALYLGAAMLVSGGIRILDRTTLSAGFVGAAIIGALASLDEVLLEVLPVRRGMPELATGNLFGTLAAFSSGVLGLAALVNPLELDGGANAAFIGAAVLYAVVGTAFLTRGSVGRVLGSFILAFYAAWLVLVASV